MLAAESCLRGNMLRGLEIAASGMTAQMTRVDTIANNIANVNAAGFKRQETVIKSFQDYLIYRYFDKPQELPPAVGKLSQGAYVADNYLDFAEGPLNQTNNPLDLALVGDGFLVVRTNSGIRYTRNGNLITDSQGRLCTKNGDLVLGTDDEPIFLPTGDFPLSKITISPEGIIYAQDREVGSLRLVKFASSADLLKAGDSYYQTNQTALTSSARIKQGYLESSNVEIVKEMVNLISASRAYDFNAKVINTEDELLSKAVSNVGKSTAT
jgi:flagellar basal-body rod protein FlgF